MARRLELSLTSVGAGREGVGGADVVDSGEAGVDGDVVQSLEGGMKPSRSALALALTLPLALALGKFLTKEAFDTVICTGEMIWMSNSCVMYLVGVLSVQEQADENHEDKDERVCGVEVGEDKAGH